MNLESPSTILKMLNRLKWTDKFVCLKCGNDKYIKGDDLYDRKCSKCKKNVSLFKHTAFEGLRFPIEKAYGILETLVERAVFDTTAKVIKMYNRTHSGRQGYDLVDDPEEWRDPQNKSEAYEYVSLIDIIRRSKDRDEKRKQRYHTLEEIELAENRGKDFDIAPKPDKKKRVSNPELIDEKIEEILNRWRPSIGMLAQKYELEENTVVKFLEKINLRLRSIYRGESDNPLERILSQLENDYQENISNRQMSVTYFLGMAMVPLIGEWKYGLAKINGKGYTIEKINDYSNEWAICRATGSHDGVRYIFNTYECIEYGTDEWRELFNINTDK